MHLAVGKMNYTTWGGGEMKGLTRPQYTSPQNILSAGPEFGNPQCVCVCEINSKHVYSVLWFIKILHRYFIQHQEKYLKR